MCESITRKAYTLFFYVIVTPVMKGGVEDNVCCDIYADDMLNAETCQKGEEEGCLGHGGFYPLPPLGFWVTLISRCVFGIVNSAAI